MPKNTKSMKNSSKRSEQVKKELVIKFEDTEYGRITKLLGDCNFTVKCFDDKERLCHLRKKIKKGERALVNSLVLVGLRDYQDSKADIIYVYTRQQELELKKMGEEIDNGSSEPDMFGEEIDENVEFDFEEI